MTEKTTRYADLGVDAGKKNVRTTFGSIVDNDFPGAFVNIVRDTFAPGIVSTQHNDGDGSKQIQRLVLVLETKNTKHFAHAVDDAVSMNMGDIAASGFLNQQIHWTNTLNIGGMISDKNLKEDLMEAFAVRFDELRSLYHKHGFYIKILGGETADLPDQIRTSVFDVAVNAREKESLTIKGNVQPGDMIYGFKSDGRAAWEDQPNSGIMSNGLTLAGTCLGWSGYNEKYPGLRLRNQFTGKYRIDDTDPLIEDMTVFEAVTSPTRQWAIIIRMLANELRKHDSLHMLHGISMNTGGGATKIGHVGYGIVYKKKMPEAPGIFQLIQREGNVSWEEMLMAFNCGIGLDIVGEDHEIFRGALATVSEKSNVSSLYLGHTEEKRGTGNKVVLETPYGTFDNY